MLKITSFLFVCSICAALQAQVLVIDDTGASVFLEQPAQRIATLSPHSAELVITAGMSEKLIAVADFDDYPQKIDQLPKISSFNGLVREQLLLLKPDLVIAWASGNKTTDIQWLLKQNIPVFQSEPAKLSDIAANMVKIAILAGAPEMGKNAARQFNHDLAASCPLRKEKTTEPTYYEIWPDPPMTIGGKHWLNEVLELARLQNIFKDQPGQIITVEPEALLARPATIHISVYRNSDSPFVKGRLIKANHLLSRPGPRIIEGIRALCTNL